MCQKNLALPSLRERAGDRVTSTQTSECSSRHVSKQLGVGKHLELQRAVASDGLSLCASLSRLGLLWMDGLAGQAYWGHVSQHRHRAALWLAKTVLAVEGIISLSCGGAQVYLVCSPTSAFRSGGVPLSTMTNQYGAHRYLPGVMALLVVLAPLRLLAGQARLLCPAASSLVLVCFSPLVALLTDCQPHWRARLLPLECLYAATTKVFAATPFQTLGAPIVLDNYWSHHCGRSCAADQMARGRATSCGSGRQV